MTSLLVGVIVLAWLMYRTLQTRNVREGSRPILYLVLGVIGLLDTVGAAKGHHVPTIAAAMLIASFAGGAVFGAIRASTVRIWEQNGQLLRKGTWVTAGLWLVSLAVHLGFDALISAADGPKNLGSSSILLYLAITWAVQSVVVQRRAAPHRARVGWGPR